MAALRLGHFRCVCKGAPDVRADSEGPGNKERTGSASTRLVIRILRRGLRVMIPRKTNSGFIKSNPFIYALEPAMWLSAVSTPCGYSELCTTSDRLKP